MNLYKKNISAIFSLSLIMVVTIACAPISQLTFSDFEGQPNYVEFVADGHIKVHSEIIIDAPPEKVWAVLTDFEALSEWSNGLQSLEGDFRKNGFVKGEFSTPFGMVPTEHELVHFEEGRMFGWSDPFSMLVISAVDNHIYLVEPYGESQSLFVQTDEFTEGTVATWGDMLGRSTLENYVEFNKRLKERVESMN